MNYTKLLCFATFALAISASHAASTIFSHTFNEGTGGLDDIPVDTGTGSWSAADVVTANGVFATNAGSATLLFTPSNGFEYYLDARILNVTGNGNWVALGFANGQNTNSDVNNRFITGNVVGTAWSLFRGSNDLNPNASHLGNGTLGSGNNGLGAANWTTLNTSGGSIDLRILLDTTGGDGNWTVTWLAKLITDTDYTVVRPWLPDDPDNPDNITTAEQENYTSVGFAFSAGGATNLQGQLASFSLTAIPEPSTALLGGLGMLALLRRRR